MKQQPPQRAPYAGPLPKSVAPNIARRIEHWDDERNCDNGIIVTLAPGWAFEPSPSACHVHGFDNVVDAIKGIRAAEPCNCGNPCPCGNPDQIAVAP